MTSTQLQVNSELVSPKTKRSSKKESTNSLKLLSGTNQKTRSTKKRLRKTKRTPRKSQTAVDNVSTSSLSSSSETSVENVASPRRKKRRTKKRSYERTVESLATVGRVYGNNVSKQNVSKKPERSPTVDKLSYGVSSTTAASREYGDFFSCQTGLTHLETNRVDQIHSKGIRRFTDEYLKKLKKCEQFESAHKVQPFASVRLGLLTEDGNENPSSDDPIDRRRSVDVSIDQDKADESKNLSAAALKTIKIIKKFKSGQSIDADLQVNKKRDSVVASTKNNSRQEVVRSGSNKSRSTSNEKNQSTVAKTTVKNATKSPNFDKIDAGADKSKEKLITAPNTVAKISDRKLQSIEEAPSEDTIIISLGQNSQESLEPPTQSISTQDGYVLMKKILTSSENTVTIINGEKRYDTKNQKVESHFSGRMPIPSKVADDKGKSVKSIKTLYRTDGVDTPRNKRTSFISRIQ